MKRQKGIQQELPFRGRGGPRRGAGRKPKGDGPGVSHGRREIDGRDRVCLVTVRLREGLPFLREKAARAVLYEAFLVAKERFGMRLVHFSVQGNHIHLIVEAEDRDALSRGMQGLTVRIARGLNRLWRRRGGVFDDRYHLRVLKSPREVRYALQYVLQNGVKHRFVRPGRMDPFASGRWFQGWRDAVVLPVSDNPIDLFLRPVAEAFTWLLKVGWLRAGGRLSLSAVPAL